MIRIIYYEARLFNSHSKQITQFKFSRSNSLNSLHSILAPFFLINYYFVRSTQSTFFSFHTIATKNIYIMNLSLKSQSALATSQSPCTAQISSRFLLNGFFPSNYSLPPFFSHHLCRFAQITISRKMLGAQHTGTFAIFQAI